MLTSCTKQKATVFEIGQTRESVINTIVNDFYFYNDFTEEKYKMTKEEVLDRENGNCITLYECEYKGQYFYKFRVYYYNEKVSQMQIKTPKEKYINLPTILEDEYGLPHKTRIKYMGEVLVYMGENSAVILIEDEEEFEIKLFSGEKKEQLNELM